MLEFIIGRYTCVSSNIAGTDISHVDVQVNDIDECLMGQDSCHQLCFNTNGSYRCDCYDGYALGADQLKCEGNYAFLSSCCVSSTMNIHHVNIIDHDIYGHTTEGHNQNQDYIAQSHIMRGLSRPMDLSIVLESSGKFISNVIASQNKTGGRTVAKGDGPRALFA